MNGQLDEYCSIETVRYRGKIFRADVYEGLEQLIQLVLDRNKGEFSAKALQARRLNYKEVEVSNFKEKELAELVNELHKRERDFQSESLKLRCPFVKSLFLRLFAGAAIQQRLVFLDAVGCNIRAGCLI
ncbi:unnamed protein product [Sphagnum balticum]